MKLIDSDIVIGKALIYSGLEYLSFEQIYQYLNVVDDLLPEGCIVDNNGYNAIESFCINYNCLVNRIDDKIVVKDRDNPNYQIWDFLKTALPEEINEILKKATFGLQDSSLSIVEDKPKNVGQSSLVLKKSNSCK